MCKCQPGFLSHSLFYYFHFMHYLLSSNLSLDKMRSGNSHVIAQWPLNDSGWRQCYWRVTRKTTEGKAVGMLEVILPHSCWCKDIPSRQEGGRCITWDNLTANSTTITRHNHTIQFHWPWFQHFFFLYNFLRSLSHIQ